MRTYYELDAKILSKLKASEVLAFQNWMVELEGIMNAFEKKYGERPYGRPLAESTGLDCWYCSYESGDTPQQAFDNDRDCWD